MLAEAVQLGVSRCGGRATMANSPLGQGQTPFHRGSLGPPQNGLQTGAVLWPTMLSHSNLRGHEEGPQ
eukprot:12517282-Alexandrium_andersonii.AAC.1